MGHRQARGPSRPVLRAPLSSALHQAVRELGHPNHDEVQHVLGVIKAFAQRDAPAGAKLREKWNPGIDAPAASGRADSGDIEIDLVELLTDVGGLASDTGRGIAVFIDEMQDLGPATSQRCARSARDSPSACRSSRRRRLHILPAGLSA